MGRSSIIWRLYRLCCSRNKKFPTHTFKDLFPYTSELNVPTPQNHPCLAIFTKAWQVWQYTHSKSMGLTSPIHHIFTSIELLLFWRASEGPNVDELMRAVYTCWEAISKRHSKAREPKPKSKRIQGVANICKYHESGPFWTRFFKYILRCAEKSGTS